ncbi:MAG: FAD-dependent oxidoreductase [Chthoniobacterales bacterium]|nr:FAD-dependent oxidoreductase [Chthoniobacterales bacterium]
MKPPLRGLSILLCLISAHASEESAFRPVYSTRFHDTALGRLPAGWRDLVNYRPMRNWSVDGRGLLRVTWKDYLGYPAGGERQRRVDILKKWAITHMQGLLVYEGLLANEEDPKELTDVEVSATLNKTPDRDVFGGVVARALDRDEYYSLEFSGNNLLRLVKVSGNHREVLASTVSRDHLGETDALRISLKAEGERLTGRILDAEGKEQARVDAKDASIPAGTVGLTATTFAALSDFSIALPGAVAKLSPEEIADRNAVAVLARQEPDYPVVSAEKNPAALNTPFDKLRDAYDVVIAGAGTGGFGAALQAARMGASVLLLEETDCIGGQMANAGVTSMDEAGLWGKMTVRERGIYREFHESAVNHYYTLNKDPYTAYHFNPQAKGGYEPHVARAILYALIAETRGRKLPGGGHPVLDLATRSRVSSVLKTGDVVTGATLQYWTEEGVEERKVQSKILVDATEYGDLLPMAGVRYRVGNTDSDTMNLDAPMQRHTWPGVIKEYPEGLPPELKLPAPPPNYEEMRDRFKKYQVYGASRYSADGKLTPSPRIYTDYVSWRGMPDSTSATSGQMTEERHTKCGLIGGNDYDVTAGTAESADQRAKDELIGINKTLGIIYWFQNELGLPWSVADDETYDTAYNLAKMKERGVRPDLLPIAAKLPQCPYVREARRMIGLETLRGRDLYTRDLQDERARHWASAVAINDYGFDLHGTRDSLELDLDELDYKSQTGPFQVPFGVFIPEKVDGFLPAEKNFSQSRLVNGATRMQPSTMLNGQAVGAMAALAARQGIQPRQLNILDVQTALLASGDSLVPRWYADVDWGTPLWQATQLLALYGMMDRPGSISQDEMLADTARWGASETVSSEDLATVLQQLAKVLPEGRDLPKDLASRTQTRAELALRVADLMRKKGRYTVTVSSPYAPQHILPERPSPKEGKKKKKASTEPLRASTLR